MKKIGKNCLSIFMWWTYNSALGGFVGLWKLWDYFSNKWKLHIINHMKKKKNKFSKHPISEIFSNNFSCVFNKCFWKVWESFIFQRNFFGTKFANVLGKKLPHFFILQNWKKAWTLRYPPKEKKDLEGLFCLFPVFLKLHNLAVFMKVLILPYLL